MKRFGPAELTQLAAEARAGGRGRRNLNWHDPATDRIQRFFNLMLPGTYVRPHRHAIQRRWELTLLLDGAADLLTFDDAGCVLTRERLAAGALLAVEVPPAVWHAYVVTGACALLFEVKQGPYDAARDKRFADWAPAEGETGAAQMYAWLLHASPGDRPPASPG